MRNWWPFRQDEIDIGKFTILFPNQSTEITIKSKGGMYITFPSYVSLDRVHFIQFTHLAEELFESSYKYKTNVDRYTRAWDSMDRFLNTI